MKKLLLAGTLLFSSFSFTAQAQNEKKEAPKSPRVTVENTFASVSYGQPSKKGRVIFGELVPYGQVWRTGANMSTDITFKTDVVFAGQEVKKGTYALFTIPGEKEWTIILNSKPEQRGASDYEKTKEQNVLEVQAAIEKTSVAQEALALSFPEGMFVIAWDDVAVRLPLQVKN